MDLNVSVVFHSVAIIILIDAQSTHFWLKLPILGPTCGPLGPFYMVLIAFDNSL